MSNLQHDRLAAETSEEQEARLQRTIDCHHEEPMQIPLFEQHCVQTKMGKFHAHM